ncbi:uncharacterized protein LOC129976571 [Argiope bruennichi]|uniref:uncharacterized protein LOC129976571 n=1 Tax=Argiope bruennichi TaxID=94029 RepID=UPI002495A2FB|nr:uncharacterized protein LOC129976571 [Argiope bruennichi]
MHQNTLPFPSNSGKDRRISNIYINPTYDPTISNIRRVENRNLNGQNQEVSNRLSYQEIIRNSIQIPENPPRRKNRCPCKLFDEDHKEERLFIAHVLLVTLFVMTFGGIGISILIQTIPLTFFPACWKLTIALAFLTFLIGVYICWEDNIYRSPQQHQARIIIT